MSRYLYEVKLVLGENSLKSIRLGDTKLILLYITPFDDMFSLCFESFCIGKVLFLFLLIFHVRFIGFYLYI